MNKKFELFLESQVEKILKERMDNWEDEEITEEQEGEASPVDSFIASIQSSCGEDLQTITSTQDKILTIAKIGKTLFNMNPSILAEVFTTLAEMESQGSEEEPDVDVDQEPSDLNEKKKLREDNDDQIWEEQRQALLNELSGYDYPLEIAEDEGEGWLLDSKVVNSAEEFVDFIISQIQRMYESWDDFYQSFGTWMNIDLPDPYVIASEMHYESHDGMAIGISEYYGISIIQ